MAPLNSTLPDATQDIFHRPDHALQTLFYPKVVALVGASDRPGSVGRTVFKNLLATPFGGEIYPINPSRESVLDKKAFKSLSEVPDKIDLVIIVTPAQTVPALIQEAVNLGIPTALIISAGFKEAGPEGQQLEQEILRIAKNKMRIIGPNCLGFMNPVTGLNATFAQSAALPGKVAFLSQSGALCTAILDWSLQEKLGFSAFVSTGSMADVGWGDLIDYFGEDSKTESIVIYMESVGDARSFVSAAREVCLRKPIIIIKAGRTGAAAKAAASHTGSLTGSDAVLDAAFERCGVLRVNDISEIFHLANILGKQPLPKGPRLGILTNAGGPGVLATDALYKGQGQLAEISPQTLKKLNEFLPKAWSHGNPMDILGDAEIDRYEKTLSVITQDSAIDGLLVVMTPQGMTDPKGVAQAVAKYAHSEKMPIYSSWMGGKTVEDGAAILGAAGIPDFEFPDDAAKTFNYLWKYQSNLNSLYETPLPLPDKDSAQAREQVANSLQEIRATGRTLLTEFESKEILKAYQIPTVETRIAMTKEKATQFAIELGFPVVLKVHSETITHKTDVGGVILNLNHPEEVQLAFEKIQTNIAKLAKKEDFLGVTVQPMVPLDGYELILGCSPDPQFGPVLLFGMGGQLVEVFKDRALALPPLNTHLARKLMEHTQIFTALLGVRGRKSVDIFALENILVRFGQLILDHPVIAEMDINPLIASEKRLLALDARVVLHPKATTNLPMPAIRPYPSQYISVGQLKNGSQVQIRPIRPDDENLMLEFHRQLSQATIYARYFTKIELSERTAHARLSRLCFVDYDREIALLAEQDQKIIGISRIKKLSDRASAQLSMVIHDNFQNQGLGTELMTRLIQIAQDENLKSISALMMKSNLGMKKLCERNGFEFSETKDGLLAVKNL